MITIEQLPILPNGFSDRKDQIMYSSPIEDKPRRLGLVSRKTLYVTLLSQVSESDKKEIAKAVEEHFGKPAVSINSPPPIMKTDDEERIEE